MFSSLSKERTGRRGRRGREPRKYSSRKLIHTGVFASEGAELKLLQQITKLFFLLISLEANDNTIPTFVGWDVYASYSSTSSFLVTSRRRTSRLLLQKAPGDVRHLAASSPDSHNTAKTRGPFKVQLWQYIFIYIFIAVTVLTSSTNQLQRASSSSSTVMKMNGEIRKLFWPPVLHLTSPLNPTTTPSSLSHNTPASVCSGGDAKNRRPDRTKQTSGGVGYFFFFVPKRAEVLPGERGEAVAPVQTEGGQWWWWGKRGGRGGCVPQCSDFRRLKETRWWRGAAVWRDPAPSDPGGASPLLDSRGWWGVVFQPRRGVVSPPQPPPFLAGLIFHLSWSSSSSNLCFFPPMSPGGGCFDIRTQSAASGCRSVGGVHGAVTSLLLLFLLQEELLQRRRARLHHGARPDRLQSRTNR